MGLDGIGRSQARMRSMKFWGYDCIFVLAWRTSRRLNEWEWTWLCMTDWISSIAIRCITPTMHSTHVLMLCMKLV